MKVLVEQQALTYLLDVIDGNKTHEENTCGFYWSDLENTWVAYNTRMEFKECKDATESLNFLMSCK